MITEFTERGKPYLGVPLGSPAGHSLARLTSMKDRPGWVVQGGGTAEWRFEGFMQRPDGLYLYGPHFGGVSLESVLALPLPEALPYLGRLVDALQALAAGGSPLFPLQTDGVFFIRDGGVLFLPPEVLRELRALRTFAENRDTFEAVNHPDLKGEAAASFSLSALLHRISVSRFPFTGASEEEIHQEERKREVIAPQTLVPDLPDWLSKIVVSGLQGARGPAVKLSRWKEELAAHGTELRREVPAEERERLEKEARELERSAGRRFKRRTFLEKNYRLLLVLAAVAVGAGFAIGSIVKGALAPRATHGFSPQKIVESFYNSMSTLNSSLMEACVTGGAGSAEISEATNLFVMSRANMAYTGQSTIVNAAEWMEKGRPVLPAPMVLYGVTGLVITPLQSAPEPVFKVTYEKWYPVTNALDSGAPSAQAPPSTAHDRITDMVFLKKVKDDWLIYKIDRVSVESLGELK